ncbi:increased DNA methylation 3-like [Ipomoea triloba]|uniref:increased DNA methylation 3-like n=1 Tax=Ipomoea triloba TaxID=35885 RepID=UPI00125DA19A|nr:increased DNA methylation 3-like [Ipomoea triloba]XP_031123333.1 increased DNA methylation 3-like [Ipomoea triloba]XP_031123343.1 increased DNA methylation 3-like [Ipomoea triloba]GLL45428.1 increased DNA methylation 3-like [Ipomoea trifida]GMD31078.1 increased DNA methylation 3-like [Ipomoea batatas]GMD85972.1 increased DNA methylation 3-like [Ipomoea batatas]GMD92696.1 increased DNA methylation 3-like [Ipomoea batatas]GME18397.1 increased DNA methylation 3-like [Ipomoea batatas]
MSSHQYAELPQVKPLVTLSGTAKEGAIGPTLGLIDIGESEYAYLFQVSLPGVRDKGNLKCEIQRDGKVQIEGVVSESQLLKNASEVYQVNVQELCPPGPFTVSFSLPGAVDPRLCSLTFRQDGILEVVVLKFGLPRVSAEGLSENWSNGWFQPS